VNSIADFQLPIADLCEAGNSFSHLDLLAQVLFNSAIGNWKSATD